MARLALRSTLRDARLPSTFISCAKLPQMEANLRSATHELSSEEEACLAQIRTLFSARPPIRWEVRPRPARLANPPTPLSGFFCSAKSDGRRLGLLFLQVTIEVASLCKPCTWLLVASPPLPNLV